MEKNKGINTDIIKLIAIFTMLTDHTGILLIGKAGADCVQILRMVGRFSMPLYAFLLAEGFYHTSDIKKYLFRVLLFAFITEIPYDLFLYGKVFSMQGSNILFTFAIAISVLFACRECDIRGSRFVILKIFIVIFGMAAAYLLKTDYSYRGVALVVIIYYTRFNEYLRVTASSLVLLLSGKIEALAAPFAFVILHFYNGKKGRINKWVVYVIYPAQFLVFYMIGRLI